MWLRDATATPADRPPTADTKHGARNVLHFKPLDRCSAAATEVTRSEPALLEQNNMRRGPLQVVEAAGPGIRIPNVNSPTPDIKMLTGPAQA